MVEDPLIAVMEEVLPEWVGYKIPRSKGTRVKFLQGTHTSVEEHNFAYIQGDLVSSQANTSTGFNLTAVVGDRSHNFVKHMHLSSVPSNPLSFRRYLLESLNDFLKDAAVEFLEEGKDDPKEYRDVGGLSEEDGDIIELADFSELPPIDLSRLQAVVEQGVKSLFENRRYRFILEPIASVSYERAKRRIFTTENVAFSRVDELGGLSLYGKVLNQKNREARVQVNRIFPNLESLLQAGIFEQAMGDLKRDSGQFRNTKPIRSGRYFIIMYPQAAATWYHEVLMAHIVSGEYNVDDFVGALRGNFGEIMMSTDISIHVDPLAQGGFNYTRDDEGVLGQKVTIIHEGRLVNFLLGRESALQMKQWVEEQEQYEDDFAERIYRIMQADGGFVSNGHARVEFNKAAPEPRLSNMIVESSNRAGIKQIHQEARDRALDAGHKYYLIAEGGGSAGEVETEEGEARVYTRKIWAVNVHSGEKFLLENPKIIDSTDHARGKDRIVLSSTKNYWDLGLCGADSGWVTIGHNVPITLLANTTVHCEPDKKKATPPLKYPIGLSL
ncbi:metallopeptidase TldD-related protein [Pseudomonadota bacterium]